MIVIALCTAYVFRAKINKKLWPLYFSIWPPYFEYSGAGTVVRQHVRPWTSARSPPPYSATDENSETALLQKIVQWLGTTTNGIIRAYMVYIDYCLLHIFICTI